MIAEAVGTFFLVFVGGAAISHDFQAALGVGRAGAAIGLIGIALAHGLALSVGISATMNVSGGQLNPAVSVALSVIKKQSWSDTIAYIVAQCIGGGIAGFIIAALYPSSEGAQFGTPELGPGVTPLMGLVAEMVGTFMLMFAVMGTAVDPRAPKIGGFGIGLTLGFTILAIGPFSGAALNPAREFGTALPGTLLSLSHWTFANHWVYWAGPILGACLAAALYNGFLMKEEAPAAPSA
jgi:aquaporin Z